MQHSSRLVGLVLLGTILQRPVPGLSQKPKTTADIVGSWQFVPNGAAKDSEYAGISHTLTFRPDSVWLEMRKMRMGADTFSCTYKLRYNLSGSTLNYWYWFWDRKASPQTPKIFTAGDTANWGPNSPKPLLQNQQLAMNIYNDGAMIFTRVASPPPATNYIAPRTGPAPTGPAAGLVGTWEKDLNRSVRDARDSTAIRNTLTILSDLTFVDAVNWKDGVDTFSCTTGRKQAVQSIKGDTLFMPDGFKYLVQGQELLALPQKPDTGADRTKPFFVYKRTTSPKQP